MSRDPLCLCGHPDPPADADPTDPRWCQHVRFRNGSYQPVGVKPPEPPKERPAVMSPDEQVQRVLGNVKP
jgi:hypothetical protein